MKFGVLSFALCVTILYAEDMIPENEELAEEKVLDEKQRGCIAVGDSCLNNRNGCCKTDKWFKKNNCFCYTAAKDKKRYNTAGKSEFKCFCKQEVEVFG